MEGNLSADKALPFERVVLPHLDAAYNLARWLAGNDHDAEDITQEACMRAFRFLHGYCGGDGRAWVLAIVRNTAYSWLKKTGRRRWFPLTTMNLQKLKIKIWRNV